MKASSALHGRYCRYLECSSLAACSCLQPTSHSHSHSDAVLNWRPDHWAHQTSAEQFAPIVSASLINRVSPKSGIEQLKRSCSDFQELAEYCARRMNGK